MNKLLIITLSLVVSNTYATTKDECKTLAMIASTIQQGRILGRTKETALDNLSKVDKSSFSSDELNTYNAIVNVIPIVYDNFDLNLDPELMEKTLYKGCLKEIKKEHQK